MSRHKPKPEIAISDHELLALTKSMDDLHHDQSLPALKQAVDEWQESLAEEGASRRGTSRRNFLLGAGGLMATGGLLAACGTSVAKKPTRSSAVHGGGTTSGGSKLSSGDARNLAVDASIENLAIFAYTQGIVAAKAGHLGKVPPAVPVFAETALSQHKAHAAAFNSVLTAAGLKAVSVPDPVLTPKVKQAFAKVTDVTGLAELALLLENVAAQSYQDDVASLSSKHARATTASIQPVEMTHAAVLYFVLGKYPGIQTSSGTPLAFNPLQLNRPSSDMTTT